jgi:ATP-binding cassette subfamily A (ABC1) protein 3
MLISSEMRCIGTPLHLKQKFSGGFVLALQCESRERVEPLDEFVRATFDGAIVEESFGTYVSYEIGALRLATAFDALEANKARLGVLDYALGEATLEKVFLGMCKQHELRDAVA